MSTDPVSPFWLEPEIVDRFAERAPDKRLVDLLRAYDEPANVSVLDLGCAGGRNTVLLAESGFDFHAVDGSKPMVLRTRERLQKICGEAKERVRLGLMSDLSVFDDDCFDIIVALGVYHQSLSLPHWHECVAESGRVLREDGLVLISAFTPDSEPEGEPVREVAGLRDIYDGFSSGPLCLLRVPDHDAAMASHGFVPHANTETVKVKTELGFRVTLNALYRKARSATIG